MKMFRRVERVAYWVEFVSTCSAENIIEAKEKLIALAEGGTPEYDLKEQISVAVPGFDSTVEYQEEVTEWRAR